MKNKKIFLVLTILLVFIISLMNFTYVNAAEVTNQITAVYIETNSSTGSNIAKPGDIINISIHFKNILSNVENISGLKIKIGENGDEKTLANKPLALTQDYLEFEYTVTENDNGLVNIISDNITIDGTEFPIPDSSESVIVDSLAPEVLQYTLGSINSEKYVTGDLIEVNIVFNENIKLVDSNQIPSLLIKFGEGNTKYVTDITMNSENIITYQYHIADDDIGNLQVLGVTGNIQDTIGNQAVLNVTFENSSTSIIANSNSDDDNNNDDDSNSSNSNADDNNGNQNPNKNTTGDDGTTSDKILPFTGSSYFMIAAIIVVAILGYISYINYRKYKGIK